MISIIFLTETLIVGYVWALLVAIGGDEGEQEMDDQQMYLTRTNATNSISERIYDKQGSPNYAEQQENDTVNGSASDNEFYEVPESVVAASNQNPSHSQPTFGTVFSQPYINPPANMDFMDETELDDECTVPTLEVHLQDDEIQLESKGSPDK